MYEIGRENLYQETCFGNKILELSKILQDQKLLYFMEFKYQEPDRDPNTTYTTNSFTIFNPPTIGMITSKFVYPDELDLIMVYYNFVELRDIPILERKAYAH